MVSKNPNNDIKTKIFFDARNGDCQPIIKNKTFWLNYSGCDLDFVADNASGNCYKVLQTLSSFEDGKNYCDFYHDAELVSFDTESEAEHFINLLKTGNKI
jgi:hypothetical protein